PVEVPASRALLARALPTRRGRRLPSRIRARCLLPGLLLGADARHVRRRRRHALVDGGADRRDGVREDRTLWSRSDTNRRGGPARVGRSRLRSSSLVSESVLALAEMAELGHKTAARSAAEDALIDAAERLLVDIGYSGITTRRLAEEAGVNHGLVHYYFGSIENVLVRTLERFTERLIERQQAMYAADAPFIEKWRTAMRFLVEEDVRYEKMWLELQALAWNRPQMRERLTFVDAQWRSVLTEAFAQPREELGIDMPLEALVALVVTFNFGVMVERLSGITTGHAELLEWIDRFLEERWRQR